MAMNIGEGGFSVDCCRVLEASGTKWIFYRRTKKPDVSMIGVSNGVDVWQQDITRSPTSTATDFSKLRSDDINLALNGDMVTLRLGTTNECCNLKKVGGASRSTELATSLFSVTERCAKVEERLAEAERTLESLKRSAASSANAHVSVFDMAVDSKKKKTQTKIQPKQAGMSIVNPGSRKRAKAKGVEFD